MSFWPQQLNFALWCATTERGVSREMLFSNSTLNLSDQIRTFYQFHVYYTTRKILYEMGGIQSKNALPDDPAFKQQENPYDVASYKRLCAEFGIDPSTDFRFTYGQNHGLGYVNIMVRVRGFRLLHLGRTGQHAKQYSWQPRYCEKHANRLSCSHRGLNKDPERIERASEVSRRDTSDKGAVELCCGSWCLAIALPYDNQHGKRCRLQQ